MLMTDLLDPETPLKLISYSLPLPMQVRQVLIVCGDRFNDAKYVAK